MKIQTHLEIISIYCEKGVFFKGVKELQCIQRKGCLMQSTTHNAATSGLHPNHGLRTPNEVFFHQIPKLWARTDNLGR